MQFAQVKNNMEQKNVVEMFLEQYDSKNTIRNYNCDLRHFFNVKNVKDITLWDIKKVKYYDIQTWIKSMFKSKSDNTIKRKISSVSSFYEYCENERVCNNPVDNNRVKKLLKLNLKKENVSKGVALTKEEINKLLSVIKNKRHHAIIRTMLHTGMRIDIEVLQIEKKDFIFKEGSWYIQTLGKGRKVRYVNIQEDLFKELEEYMDEFNITEGKIFNITAWAISKALKKYCKEAEIRKISCHDTRRTNAVRLIKNGKTIKEVRDHLGHSSMRMVERYLVEEERFNSGISEAVDW